MKREDIREILIDSVVHSDKRTIKLQFHNDTYNEIIESLNEEKEVIAEDKSESVDEYFENHPRIKPTYNELKWIKLGVEISTKLKTK